MKRFRSSVRVLRGSAPALLAGLAAAQSAAPPSASGGSPTLSEVTVIANPTENALSGGPALRVRPADLLTRPASTLGAALEALPGVSSSGIGTAMGRPSARGQDGDRQRIVQGGSAAVDASALSEDHALPIDPMAIERVEVLRGPEALRHGGQAIGGVVQVIDHRIPREPLDAVQGRVDLGLASGNREHALGAMIEGGTGTWAWHVDAFDRRGGDVHVPIELECAAPGAPSPARRVCNSAAAARGGAVGASLFFDRGRIGTSWASYGSRYGTVAEDEVRIGLRSDRQVVDGEYRPVGGPFDHVSAQWTRGDYHHTEFEGPEPGTFFKSRGDELRLQASHRPVGGLRGTVGLQTSRTDFSAKGEEAFVPPSRTRATALYADEAVDTASGRWRLGLRAESVQVDTQDGSDPALSRFATGARRFHPGSAALSWERALSGSWNLSATLSHAERAPRDYELFANGPHLATGAWVVGDASLPIERSNGLEATLTWSAGPNRARLSAFANRFASYVALLDTGRDVIEGDAALPEQTYRSVRARFAGLEASGNWRLRAAGPMLDLQWRADLVRARNLDRGEPLPRIAPWRVGATLVWTEGPWSARLGFDHAGAQNRVPANTRATAAWTMWNLGLQYRQTLPAGGVNWYARVDNLTDRLAYSATSVLTTTAFPRAPLAGRSLRLGAQWVF